MPSFSVAVCIFCNPFAPKKTVEGSASPDEVIDDWEFTVYNVRVWKNMFTVKCQT
jgi:hypothetical protein